MKGIFDDIRSNLRIMSEDLSRDGKGWILIVVGSGWFLSLGLRFMYPSMIPFLREQFQFDLTVAGLLLSLLWIAYAIGQIPGGVIGDRFGEGNVLVMSTGLSTIAVLFVSMAMDLWMLFASTIGFGLATALYGPTRFTIFTDIYSSRAGTAVGLTYAAGSLGNTILPAAAVAISSYATWRLGFGWLVPIFFIVTLAIYIAVPSRTSTGEHAVDEFSMDMIRGLYEGITVSGVPLVVGINVLLGFVNQGFIGFFPTYLIEIKGFSAQIAAIIFGTYFAFAAILQPFIGIGKDRYGSRLMLLIIAFSYFSGLVILFFATSLVHVLLITLLLSFRSSTGVITNTFIADSVPNNMKGTGLGILRTAWLLLGASGPIFVGYLGDRGYLEISVLLLAIIVFIGLVMSAFLPED